MIVLLVQQRIETVDCNSLLATVAITMERKLHMDTRRESASSCWLGTFAETTPRLAQQSVYFR